VLDRDWGFLTTQGKGYLWLNFGSVLCHLAHFVIVIVIVLVIICDLLLSLDFQFIVSAKVSIVNIGGD